MNLTVLMPTFNCSEYILYAIKSILDQTFKEFELLIIDDGSTDNTEELILQIKDSRINYVKRDHCGIVNSLNYGLKIASFDWIARMDSDDIAYPARFEVQTAFIRENPIVDIVSCNYHIFNNNSILYTVRLPEYHSEIRRSLALHSTICHPGTIFNKSKIINHDGYRETGMEDYELWLRVKDDIVFHNIQFPLMFVRTRDNSLSRVDIIKTSNTVYNIQEEYYKKDLSVEFGIYDRNLGLIVKGWREFFYGSKKKARKIWFLHKLNFIYYPKLIVSFILTFFPERANLLIKGYRLKFRLIYFLRYFNESNVLTRNYLKKYF